jgi:hypothetical protein
MSSTGIVEVAELRPDDDVALLALTAERPSADEVR